MTEERSIPLVLELQVGIGAILTSLAGITHERVFEEGLLESVAYLIADVIKLEMPVLGPEADVALVVVADGIGVIAFELESVVLFLPVDIAGDSTVLGEDLSNVVGQSDGHAQGGHGVVVDDLIAGKVGLVVGGGGLPLNIEH